MNYCEYIISKCKEWYEWYYACPYCYKKAK